MARSDSATIHWHTECLPLATQRGLETLAHASWLARSPWYLAGGTALALQVGHRESVDLDFFTPKPSFVLPALVTRLEKLGQWKSTMIEERTLYGTLHGAKASFISYPFFVPAHPPARYGAIRVLSVDDIAVMKILAISQRGRKRDFLDLFWYLHHRAPLAEVVRKLPVQYPKIAHNYHHIMKSFMFFDDAENDVMPRLSFRADWNGVKSYFRRIVPDATKEVFLSL